MELMQASHQWATRPDDERFISLDEMSVRLGAERDRSVTRAIASSQVNFAPIGGDEIKGLQLHGPNGHPAVLTHWSFGQMAQLAGASSGLQYLRSLPSALAADCLNYGFKYTREIQEFSGLLTFNDARTQVTLRSANGMNYGRVWSADMVDALRGMVGDGVTGDWRVPGVFGKPVDVTRANTTLFGSDRNLFIFLADETRRVEIPNRRNGRSGSMARGFFVWGSEVGAASMGGAFFLFDYVCGNRIVWGAEQYSEIRLRHTKGAPDRWLSEILPILDSYSRSSGRTVTDAIEAAKAAKIEDAKAWLAARYTKTAAAQYGAAFLADEGRPMESLWDITTGMTAYARSLPHQDARVAIEREAGKVLALAAPALAALPAPVAR